jgi:TPR repeat protein
LGGQNNLGFCFQYGIGTEIDIGRAIYWFQKSADQGNPHAQNNLGCFYLHEKDFTKALFFFQLAVYQRIPVAQYNLGLCYQCGDGIDENMEIAKFW